jgi:REP element-mobilizing transposase RayT
MTDRNISEAESSLEATAVSKSSQKVQQPEETPEELEDTRPHPVTEGVRKIVLESVSPSAYNLTYACLLIPRFQHHHLTGDLADRLSEWVPKTCVAYGWRLEFLSIRPDYLQWIVNVPPATPPSYLMRIMRQQTSEKIFDEFPRFKRDNPSGDYWAPGYLIMGGSQPHPAQLVKDFIAQVRQRQGTSKHIR